MCTMQGLVDVLREEPGFERLFSLLREKYRSYGRIGENAKVILRNPTANERRVLERFFGESFNGVTSISISVAKLHKAIQRTKFKEAFDCHDVNELVQMYFGGSLTSKKEERSINEQIKSSFFQSLLEKCEPKCFFYKFIEFIQVHRSASRIHSLYNTDPELLRKSLEIVASLLNRLPLKEKIYLPMLAYELTGDARALGHKTVEGKMLQYALQVLNHLAHDVDIVSTLTDEQVRDLFEEFSILYCPEANRLSSNLLIADPEQGIPICNKGLIPLQKLGEGAFAQVYRVYDPNIHAEVACKVLFDKYRFRQSYGKDGEEYIQRFKREVRTLQKEISHPNIISVDKTQLQKAPYWFTMPLAVESLESWIENNQDITEETRLNVYKQIVDGVKHLHERRIHHRDLSPSNILLFNSSVGNIQARIADFGLVKDHQSLSVLTRLSVNGYGRWDFAAPEQIKSLVEADHQSDIYSLGALLYYILSGNSPERRYISSVRYQFIIAKAMEDDRSKRYQLICELEKDLEDAMHRRLSNKDFTFYGLINYEYKGAPSDVLYTLECISVAKIEERDKVVDQFIKPLLCIPTEVLISCCEYKVAMFPFVEIINGNLDNIQGRAATIPLKDWDEIILLVEALFNGLPVDLLKASILKMILKIAFIFNIPSARPVIGRIIESLPNEGGIVQEVAQVLEMDFSSHHDSLIQILDDKDYPTPIRFAIGDW